jgi:Trypsin-co-occurring domain 2
MDSDPAGEVDLADAIRALRDALIQAIWDGRHSRIRFQMDPVDLTVNVGVTRTGGGTAGVKWHILTVAGERSRRLESAQTLKLRLTPVLLDENGDVALGEMLVADRADSESAAMERPAPDPA